MALYQKKEQAIPSGAGNGTISSMRRDTRTPESLPRENSLMVAFASCLVFLGLTQLAAPPWISAERGSSRILLLTLAHFIPLAAWTLGGSHQFIHRILILILSAIASLSLLLHGALLDILVANLDAGMFWSKTITLHLLELSLSILSIPAGLWYLDRIHRVRLIRFVGIPALFGALGQMLFFFFARLIQGPSGLEFWMAARILIMAAVGLIAGLFTFANAVFRPKSAIQFSGGFTAFFHSRVQNILPWLFLISLAFFLVGVLRVVVQKHDRGRFVTVRLDDYFLSLSNLTSARSHGLWYAELTHDLTLKRSALFGAASFDPVLVRRLRPMVSSVESQVEGPKSRAQFEKSVMAVNRRLLTLGEPYFLEPHSLGKGDGRIRFVLRYQVVRQGRCGLEKEPSIPMLRLRRMDDIAIDTLYTGLSYQGIGTILMDHIETVLLRSYLPLFHPTALSKRTEDGKWAATFQLIRRDAKQSLSAYLIGRDGYRPEDLQKWAMHILDARPRAIPDLRQQGSAETNGLFDRMVALLAQQTEIHETRHATDRELSEDNVVKLLASLTVHALGKETAAEVRAYLSEMVDGPLGPKFTLATLGKLLIEPDASANAYFFASVIILEGLTGEKVRRPDVVEVRRGETVRQVLMPIDENHPGWLSFSRIHGAYADLSAQSDEVLRERAVQLFEHLFEEDYSHIERRR